MARDDLLVITEGLQQILETQADDHAILERLERRPTVDLGGVERRLDDLADSVTRQAPPRPRSDRQGWGWSAVLIWVIPWVLAGYLLCWSTARYLPTWYLPPGFGRTGGKGK